MPHHVYVADAFEREIGAALGEIDNRLHDFVFANFVRINEMRQAEFFRDFAPRRIEIDADDLIGAGDAGALDHVEADAAKAEYRDVRAAEVARHPDMVRMPVVTPQPM